MDYIEQLINQRHIQQIFNIEDFDVRGFNRFIWVNRKLGVFYFLSTRSPISTYKRLISSMVNNAELVKDGSFREFVKGTSKNDWDLYQIINTNTVSLNETAFSGNTDMKSVSKMARSLYIRKSPRSGAKYAAYKVTTPSSELVRWTIDIEGRPDEDVIDRVRQSLKASTSVRSHRELLKMYPFFSKEKDKFLRTTLYDVTVDDSIDLGNLSVSDSFSQITRKLNRTELNKIYSRSINLPIPEEVQLRHELTRMWAGVKRFKNDNGYFTIYSFSKEQTHQLVELFKATNGTAEIIKQMNETSNCFVLMANNGILNDLWTKFSNSKYSVESN